MFTDRQDELPQQKSTIVLTKLYPHQFSQNQPPHITYLGLIRSIKRIRYLASKETAQKNKFPVKNTDR